METLAQTAILSFLRGWDLARSFVATDSIDCAVRVGCHLFGCMMLESVALAPAVIIQLSMPKEFPFLIYLASFLFAAQKMRVVLYLPRSQNNQRLRNMKIEIGE
jgi:hypothetical protein